MRPVPEKNRLSERISSKRARRISALLLSLLLLLPGLTGCRKGTEDGGAENGGSVTQGTGEAEILTHVFRPETFAVPEDWSLYSMVTPRYDPETGVLTYLATHWEDRTDEDGNLLSESRAAIVEASTEAILSRTEIPVEMSVDVSGGLFTENGLVCLFSSFDPERGTQSFSIASLSSEGEILARCEDASALFDTAGEGGWFHIDRTAADGEGNIYLSTQREVAVLTPSLEKSFSVTVPDWISAMAADGEGRVWITGYFGNGQGMAPINPAARALGDPVELPNGMNELFFGPGHGIYYRGDDGLYGADFDENGKIGEGQLIMDFLNSDVSRDMMTVLAVYGPEEVLLSEYNGTAPAPAVYHKVPDIDLSAVTVLRLAYTTQLEYFVPRKVIAFNKSHDDVRIVTESYINEGDYYGGENRLAAEMAAGSRPDIVITTKEGPALSAIVKHGLYADLTPYAERPGNLNKDNIMGCVKRTFTDGEGRLFAVASSFTLRGYITTDALLGEYAGRDSLTPEELLDFAESLPADRLLMEGLTRESAASSLLGPGGYASFIDGEGKSCSFDSDLFIRYLTYIASLPTWEEYSAHPPIEGLNADRSERYKLYHDGKIALKLKSFHEPVDFLGAELDFGTKDWRLIGQPANGDYGVPIGAESVYVVTAPEGERADLAWEVLSAVFDPEGFGVSWGIPGLVSVFEQMVEEYYTYDFAFTYSGSASWGTKNPDRERRLDEPGILTEFTEADERRIRDVLDNHCGVPYTASADEDVTAIVEEEISVFLGGVGSAEDCAKKIQSRVSILLAEKG